MLQDAISKIRKALQEVRQIYSSEAVTVVEQVLADVKDLNTFIGREIEIIETDRHLSDGKKRNERRQIFEQAARKLELLKEKRTQSALIERLEAKLTEAPGTAEGSVLQFLREREVRDRIYGMPPAQILSHFGKSLFDGSNRLMLDAILNAPSGFEMLPEDTIQKLREVRTKILKPEITAELDAARRLNTRIEQLFLLTRNEIDRLRRKELPASFTGGDATEVDHDPD